MNAALFLFIFSIIGTAILASVFSGFLYFRKDRNRQIAERLGSEEQLAVPTAYAVTILNDERKTAFYVRVQSWAMSQVDAAGLKWSSSKVLAICLASAVVGIFVGVRAAHMLPRSAAAFSAFPTVFFASLPFLYLRRLRRKRLNKFESQFPDALDFIARSLRVGNSFLMTLEMLVEESEEPLRGEFRRLTGEIRLGSPIAEPLQKLVLRVPLVDLRMFSSAVLLQRETGGNLGALLTRIAASIRDRFRVRGQVVTAASQAQLSARVISAMPFVVLGGILLLSPTYLTIMTDDPLGRKLLAAAALGQLIGFLVMRNIVRIKV